MASGLNEMWASNLESSLNKLRIISIDMYQNRASLGSKLIKILLEFSSSDICRIFFWWAWNRRSSQKPVDIFVDTDNKFRFTFIVRRVGTSRTFQWSPQEPSEREREREAGTRNVIKWWINWNLKRVSRCHINRKFQEIFFCCLNDRRDRPHWIVLSNDLAHYHHR